MVERSSTSVSESPRIETGMGSASEPGAKTIRKRGVSPEHPQNDVTGPGSWGVGEGQRARACCASNPSSHLVFLSEFIFPFRPRVPLVSAFTSAYYLAISSVSFFVIFL